MTPDDPARRLHEALDRVLEYGREKGSAPTGDVLKGAIQARSAAHAVGQLFAMLAEVQSGLRRLEGQREVDAYLIQIQPIESWMSQLNLGSGWHGHRTIDMRAHAALLTCSDQLQAVKPLRRIDNDDLDGLRTDARRLLDDVLAAVSLDTDLRLHLIRSLQAFLDALTHYTLTGSAPLADAVESALGDYAVRRPKESSEESTSLRQRFVQLCANALIVMSAGQTAMELPANFNDAYERLRSGVEQTEPKALEPPTLELNPGPTTSED